MPGKFFAFLICEVMSQPRVCRQGRGKAALCVHSQTLSGAALSCRGARRNFGHPFGTRGGLQLRSGSAATVRGCLSSSTRSRFTAGRFVNRREAKGRHRTKAFDVCHVPRSLSVPGAAGRGQQLLFQGCCCCHRLGKKKKQTKNISMRPEATAHTDFCTKGVQEAPFPHPR